MEEYKYKIYMLEFPDGKKFVGYTAGEPVKAIDRYRNLARSENKAIKINRDLREAFRTLTKSYNFKVIEETDTLEKALRTKKQLIEVLKNEEDLLNSTDFST